MNLTLKRLIANVCTIISLSGCMALGGTQVEPGDGTVYDHRGMSMMMSDREICSEAEDALSDEPTLEGSYFDTLCFEHTLLLVGQTANAKNRALAYKLASEIPHVAHVENQVELGSPENSSSHVHDTWLNTKVRSSLLADSRLHSTQIKVLVENGVVYLMGKPPANQAKFAAETASKVAGISKVVTLFTPLTLKTT